MSLRTAGRTGSRPASGGTSASGGPSVSGAKSRSAASRRKAHLAAVADVLDELAGDIELLGAVLCADPVLVDRHMQELQAIDLITQKQRSLGMLLRADCPASALSSIGLDDLKHRLAHLATAASRKSP